jgi:UDP-N-acetylglucosamine--N-acetylmuramyl-(pentapeptide) pyrophosphoryl-undecaprenol N-acetylglucosamine transferase
MSTNHTLSRVIISGGGTGGHIFPALAIANAIKLVYPLADILFVGAEGKMEMQKVPEAGYKIVGLPIAGIQRSWSLKNLSLPYKLFKSLKGAAALMKSFKPQIVIGVGGYASGPTLLMAQLLGIPTLLQEQNSYAGLTNKWLAKRAAKICVAYDGMETFFPSTKLIKTGNPVRAIIGKSTITRKEAIAFWVLKENCKTLLVIGGSLGARTINESIAAGLENLTNQHIQVLWQTGKGYFETAKQQVAALGTNGKSIQVFDFIKEMDQAYAVADLVVSRAGALSVSELCVAKKAAILVPSPNVAEDHQTKNAKALSTIHAAILVTDAAARAQLIDTILEIINSESSLTTLSNNSAKLSITNADERILKVIEQIVDLPF